MVILHILCYKRNIVIITIYTGVAKMYDLRGRFITDFQLLDMTDSTPILEIHFWGNGAAAITSSMVIKVVEVSVLNILISALSFALS